MITSSPGSISPAERAGLLQRIAKAVRAADAERPAGSGPDEAAVMEQVDRHLDALVAIVRDSCADHIEAYLTQIQEQICNGCEHQIDSGYCPLRAFGDCAFYRNARPIVDAIARSIESSNAAPASRAAATAANPTPNPEEPTMYRKILIAVDRSDPAEFAARSGMELAKSLNAKVALVTVVPGPPALVPSIATEERDSDVRWQLAERLLATHRAHLPKHFEVEQIVSEGSPGEEIVMAAKTWHADLVIVGTHNRHGLSRFLLGSTAEQVVRHAPCPVLVVRTTDEVEAKHEQRATTESGTVVG